MSKKRYGQNFLINNEVIDKILTNTEIISKNILEIGPGNLALTKPILYQKPKKYIGIEIDESLKKKISDSEIYSKIIVNDALKINERSLFNNNNFSIISNLPYNISSQLLIKWCFLQNSYNCIDEMTLMFQKELGERIVSSCNTKKYGSLSILAQAFFDIEKKLFVNKKNFNPCPKVDSIVLRFFSLKKNRIKKEKLKKLQDITQFFFNERRKINKKKILKLFNKNNIKFHQLERYYNLRAENLSREIYYKFTDIV